MTFSVNTVYRTSGRPPDCSFRNQTSADIGTNAMRICYIFFVLVVMIHNVQPTSYDSMLKFITRFQKIIDRARTNGKMDEADVKEMDGLKADLEKLCSSGEVKEVPTEEITPNDVTSVARDLGVDGKVYTLANQPKTQAQHFVLPAVVCKKNEKKDSTVKNDAEKKDTKTTEQKFVDVKIDGDDKKNQETSQGEANDKQKEKKLENQHNENDNKEKNEKHETTKKKDKNQKNEQDSDEELLDDPDIDAKASAFIRKMHRKLNRQAREDHVTMAGVPKPPTKTS